MTQARRSHEQKSLADRQRYFDTTVRGNFGPTVDEGNARPDSTETTIASGIEATRPYRRPTRAKKRNRSAVFLREHWVETVGAIVVTVIIGLLSWALAQDYSLNREVGELQTQMKATAKDQSDAKTDLQRFEDRVNQEIDRINDHRDDSNHR